MGKRKPSPRLATTSLNKMLLINIMTNNRWVIQKRSFFLSFFQVGSVN
ncbi:MAG: hypothetical protein ACI35P_13600 [Bacillus sp. (in: firmicutes)]